MALRLERCGDVDPHEGTVARAEQETVVDQFIGAFATSGIRSPTRLLAARFGPWFLAEAVAESLALAALFTEATELLVGFAADGYARVHGLGVALVTYCVGGLNMLDRKSVV